MSVSVSLDLHGMQIISNILLFSNYLCSYIYKPFEKFKYIHYIYIYTNSLSFGKESAFSAEDQGSIPGLGRSPGERNGNSLQYSCLENLVDREAWWATVYGLTRVRHYLVNKPPLNIYANKNFSKF